MCVFLPSWEMFDPVLIVIQYSWEPIDLDSSDFRAHIKEKYFRIFSESIFLSRESPFLNWK